MKNVKINWKKEAQKWQDEHDSIANSNLILNEQLNEMYKTNAIQTATIKELRFLILKMMGFKETYSQVMTTTSTKSEL